MSAPSGPMGRVPPNLRWTLALTRMGLVAERLVRAFWPVWTLGFALVALLMFGLQDVLTLEALWAMSVGSVIGGLWLLVRGAMRFRWPSAQEALAHLDATLPGRPVQALMDAPAMGQADPATRALWAAHQARMAARAAVAKAPEPNLRIAALDPFGLRFLAVIAFFVAVMFGSFARLQSVGQITHGPIAPSIAGASWGMLWNSHMQTLDYTRGQISLNRNQIESEADGTYRIVIAHEDPGVANWLDVQGHARGQRG